MLSTIVRYVDGDPIWQLERALFSISCSSYLENNSIEALVVIQSKKRIQISSFDYLKKFISTPNFVIKIVPLLSKKDSRELSLNVGIKLSKGQYISFLDYDDVIYPSAYSHLIEELIGSQSAISFGKILTSISSRFDGYSYISSKDKRFFWGRDKFDLWYENFCPIHSFVINRKKINPKDLIFPSGMIRAEDYYFLLNITSKYKSSFITSIVGEYEYRLDGSNTVRTSDSDNDPTKKNLWESALTKINDLKNSLKVTVSISELQQIITSKNKLQLKHKELLSSFDKAKQILTRLLPLQRRLPLLNRIENIAPQILEASSGKTQLKFFYSIDDFVKRDIPGFGISTDMRFWVCGDMEAVEKVGSKYRVALVLSAPGGAKLIDFLKPTVLRKDVSDYLKTKHFPVEIIHTFEGINLEKDKLTVYVVADEGIIERAIML